MVGIPSDYGNSEMGAVRGSYVTSYVEPKPIAGIVKDLNRDPATFPIMYHGQSKFILRQYTYSTTSLKNQYVYDSNGDWNNSNLPSGVIKSVANDHAAAAYGDYVFLTGYDLGKIAVCKLGTSLVEDEAKAVDLLSDIINKCDGPYEVIPGNASNPQAHGEGLLAHNGYLYVMVNMNPQGGYTPYDPSYLMQYKIGKDGSLTFVNYTRAGKNTNVMNMNLYNNMIMTAAIGGYQNMGFGNVGETSLDIGFINGDTLNREPQKVTIPEQVLNRGLDFRNMKVLPNGTAYILTYNLDGAGGGSDAVYYKTTVANLLSEKPIDWEVIIDKDLSVGTDDPNGSGWFNDIYAEYYTKRVWAMLGDTVAVYTDGNALPTYQWEARDFANNKQLYKWNSLSLLKPDEVYGEQALLVSSREEGLTTPSQTSATVINANAANLKGDYAFGITGSSADTRYKAVTTDYSNYKFNADTCINLGLIREGDLQNNILGAIYAKAGNNITVDAGDKQLQLQVKNIIATPVGIYAGNGKNVTVNAGKINVITSGLEGGNTLNNAIMNDAGLKQASNITINGEVNINMQGGYGGNGVAVQKTDRWGEASYASNVVNSITINGALNIKGADSTIWGIPINAENVFSRFNNAGLLTQVEKSRINVNGPVDLQVYGNGATVNATGSLINMAGGRITVPKGTNYGYYTLGAYQGTINMNTGVNGTTLGNNQVQLQGDIFVLPTGTVNLGLVGKDSYLRGMVDNGGTANLYLQQGATWKNVANNTRYSLDSEDKGSETYSRITNLYGGSSRANAGVILQSKDSKDIQVDKYQGNTVVLYEHDNANAIKGGKVTIASAAAGSAMVLRTDYSSSMNSEAVQNQVLNNLANKLFYTGYTKGENNLTGSVEIAEGLTASAATKYVNGISYNKSTGQGSAGEQEPGTTTYNYLGALCPAVGTVENKDGHLVTGGAVCAEGATISFTNTAQVAGALHALKGGTITIGREAQVGGSVVADKGTILLNRDLIAKGVIKAVNGGNLVIKGDSSKATAMKNDLIAKGSGSQVELNLLNKNDTLAGTITASDGGKVNLNLKNGASWTGSNCSSNTELNLENSSWNNLTTQTNQLVKLTANKGVMDMSGASGTTSVAKYSGNATLIYKHEEAQPTNIVGGNLEIGAAAAGSAIILQTDKVGINTSDAAQVKQVLNSLAGKLIYSGAVNGEKNLNGTVKIAEGLTASSVALVTGGITYDSKGMGTYTGNGKAAAQTVKGTLSSGSLTSNSVASGDNALVDQQIVYGPEETAMMQGTKSAMADAVNVWRATSNNLLKRLGDLRLQQEEQGIWAKYYSGRSKLPEASNKYKAVQVGYDHSSKNWNLGLALEYVDGKASYSRGHGKAEVKNFGLYGTRQLGAGQYLDIIGKVGRIGSDFKVKNEMGHTLEGDFSTSAQSLSLEYGKTFKLKDSSFFVEPAVELTYGHNNARSYKATSDFEDGKPLTVHQQGFESLVSRLGLRLGQQKTGYSYYGRVQWCHEFSGNMKTGYEAEGEPTSSTKLSLKGNWTELELGGTVKLSRNNYVYGSAEKSFGGKLKTDWRFDLGLRWSF